jgi:hypothetical protein
MKQSLMVLWMVLALFVGCQSESLMVRQMRKERLVSAIRQKLLESAEAEKSAVLATTDEESHALVLESQHFTTDISQLRGELRRLIVADGRGVEIEKLDAFDVAWAELERVDERLLALAAANTNLKAARLLSREGAAALDRFVDELTEIEGTVTDAEMMRTLTRASVAALRNQSLLFVHIPASDDAEMSRLEQRMRELDGEVDRSLATARENGQGLERLTAASRAWSEYQRVAAEVLRLSRENSNVISFDVSVHEKRHATKECLSALTALSAAIDVGPYGTR